MANTTGEKMNEQEIKAVNASIEKWDLLLGSHCHLGLAIKYCSLCHLPNSLVFWRNGGTLRHINGCENCPLQKAGYGCLEEDSTWDQIFTIVEDHGYDYKYLDSLNQNHSVVKKLKKLCIKMRDEIKSLLDEPKEVSNRDTNKEESTVMRTLKQMNETEQDMVRVLVTGQVNGGTYTDEDISKYLNVTLRTVAAVKAHTTMGTYNKGLLWK